MANQFKPLCPHCSSRVRVRSCERVSNTFTWLYCICPVCGAVWTGSVEASQFVNPPARRPNGQALVRGNYEFNEAGLLMPVSSEVQTMRNRSVTEVDPRQLALEIPVPD